MSNNETTPPRSRFENTPLGIWDEEWIHTGDMEPEDIEGILSAAKAPIGFVFEVDPKKVNAVISILKKTECDGMIVPLQENSTRIKPTRFIKSPSTGKSDSEQRSCPTTKGKVYIQVVIDDGEPRDKWNEIAIKTYKDRIDE